MENYIIAKATHVGRMRELNEDSLGVFTTPNGQVLVVCDGMGGQAAGDVASQLTVSIVESILTDNRFGTPDEAIRGAIHAANQGVLRRAAQDNSTDGMGSTCVMVVVNDGKVYAGWVGDSRIYYVANHTIRQISHDQSYVQQLIDSGQLSAEEAAHHPKRNEITNCIGLETMSPPATLPGPIAPEPGSIFLLCSDGLTSMVEDTRIERVLSSDNLSLQQKADRLIEMANEAGGHDNITVELLQFGTSSAGGATSGTLFDTPTVSATTKKSRMGLWATLACVVLAIIAAACWYFFFYKQPQTQSQPKSKPKTEIRKDTTKKQVVKQETEQQVKVVKKTKTKIKTTNRQSTDVERIKGETEEPSKPTQPPVVLPETLDEQITK